MISMQPNSTIQLSSKIKTYSEQRWWTYESYNDFIVGYGSRYLLIDDVSKPDECADKFISILKHTNMIQLEISKGLYGADENIMNINKKTAVNPNVRKAVGLVYIRSYLENFIPTIVQPFNELLKVKFKYENNNLIFPDWKSRIEEFMTISDEKEKCINMKEYILNGAELSNIRLKNAVNKMRELLIGNSTYINHSDYDEPNWHLSFWGIENFNKLVELKKIYDPNDIFNHKYSIPLKNDDF